MSNILTVQAELAVPCEDILGECPIWDHRSQKVVWIDIESCKFHEYDPKTRVKNTFELPDRPGSVCLSSIGTKYLFTFPDGIYFYDYEKSTVVKKIMDFESKNPKSRTNDSRVDRHGNFVAGGYVNHAAGTEKDSVPSNVYRLFPDLTYQKIIRNVGCSNSICWNLKGDIMYFCDTRERVPNRIIRRYKYDGGNSTRVLPKYIDNYVVENASDDIGFDGSIVDSDGYLWNCHFGGGCVMRYDKEGKPCMKVVVPNNKYITCACFGGKDLDTLYITTCGAVYTDEEKKERPGMRGSLYKVNLRKYGIKGLKENVFGVDTTIKRSKL